MVLSNWSVYIIQCSDDSLYTGVSTDPQRRFEEHRNGKRGARYFNGRAPVRLAYTEAGYNRSSACQRECVIKKLSRQQKLLLIAGCGPDQAVK